MKGSSIPPLFPAFSPHWHHRHPGRWSNPSFQRSWDVLRLEFTSPKSNIDIKKWCFEKGRSSWNKNMARLGIYMLNLLNFRGGRLVLLFFFCEVFLPAEWCGLDFCPGWTQKVSFTWGYNATCYIETITRHHKGSLWSNQVIGVQTRSLEHDKHGQEDVGDLFAVGTIKV